MSAHTTYYQVPSYTQHVAIPQGWRPPFQGPPPIPSGMNVNPQLWQAGKWQLNYAYFAQHQGRPTSQPTQHAWTASHAWQQPRTQESASKNPYKRVPKPPSAEYLATSLSDNPLGLTDMIPAEEYYAQQQASENDSHRNAAAVAESPWIWNPPLADEDDTTEPSSNTVHDSSRPRTPSRAPSTSSRRDSSTTVESSTSNADKRQEEDAFTAKRALVPTFSVNIVRTPEHYKSSPSRSSSRSSNHHRSSRGSTDSQQLVTRMENLTTGDLSNHHLSGPDTTNSSELTQTMSDVQNLVEEPSASLLSPLLLTTPKPQSRPLGRYSTFPMVSGPASLDTIHESSTTSRSDQQHSLRTRKSSTRNPSRVKTDPVDAYQHNHSPNQPVSNNASPYFNPSPSRSSRSSSSSRASSQQPSPSTSLSLSPHDYHTSPPTSGSSRHSNPLPVPPGDYSLGNLSSTRQKKRARKGYWNKRGDHFTRSGYVVYAPSDQVYPPELQDYPDESQGYLDENGQLINPGGQRPEHPESIPRHGHSPLRPYHSFVEYV
ncbi:hypothetical protein APHAL10511_002514 [Amanita phalloides]|nr:hypothetical protein APHAL10511_002514 [Amanita phalloides]